MADSPQDAYKLLKIHKFRSSKISLTDFEKMLRLAAKIKFGLKTRNTFFVVWPKVKI